MTPTLLSEVFVSPSSSFSSKKNLNERYFLKNEAKVALKSVADWNKFRRNRGLNVRIGHGKVFVRVNGTSLMLGWALSQQPPRRCPAGAVTTIPFPHAQERLDNGDDWKIGMQKVNCVSQKKSLYGSIIIIIILCRNFLANLFFPASLPPPFLSWTIKGH